MSDIDETGGAGTRPVEAPGAAAPRAVAQGAVAAREESPVRFGVLMAIGVTLLFQFGVQAVLMRYRDERMLPYITAVSQLLLMLLPAVYAARAQALPTRELFRMRRADLGMHIAVILGILMLWPIVQGYLIFQELYLVPDGLFDAYRQMQQRLEGLYERLLPPAGLLAPLVSIVAAALVPAICEESVFRGATQRSFERRMRPGFAIVTAALLFAGLHLQPHNLVPLAILGMFLGLVAWAGASIYPAIVGHFLFNALMIGALYTMRALGERPATHSEADLYALLPAVAVGAAGLALIVRWLIRQGRRTTLREETTVATDELTLRGHALTAPADASTPSGNAIDSSTDETTPRGDALDSPTDDDIR